MPDITMTRQTSLRGTQLQAAVNAMVAAMGRRQPFNMAPIQPRWESGTRLTFTASAMGQQQANGAIDIRDGNPSTVTAQVNLLTSLSRGYRSQVEQAMVEESERNMPVVGGSAATQTSTPPHEATQTQSQTSSQSSSSSRGDFDWDLFANILGTVTQQAGASVQAYNQAVGYTASTQAKQIAAETVASSRRVAAGPAPRASVVQRQPAAPVVAAPATPSMTTVGWIVIGAVGLGVVGLVAAIIVKKSKQSKKDED